MKYLFALTLFAGGLAQAATPSIPLGAKALGYTTQVFYDQPQLSEVSATDTNYTSKWYPGSLGHNTYSNLENRELLSTVNNELAISLGGSVISKSPVSTNTGVLPLLSGAKGFYVEFAMRLSSNNPDHFSGLYLQTAEHDPQKHDHLPTDPAGFERWTELDVSETGYGPGSLGTVISWRGIYPLYSRIVKNSYGLEKPLDLTVEHRYALSYDPATNVLEWYIDDVPSFKTTAPDTSIKDWHYYAVMEASSHGAYVPYKMFIHYVRAFSK